ncbi:MAG: RNA 2',3'-cyclic phosphodiesterase [Methanosarcinales archaeon]|nr:MAG: RNA 2',3'-cyclic phosphodiesterase [Methanosarcinales archaeon]
MIRTFIAVDFPAALTKKVAELQQHFSNYGVKVVKPEQVHITLKFLGDIEEAQIKPISDALQNVHVSPFEAEVRGVGVFPSLRHINVIWVGAEGDFDHLHTAVEEALQPLGFKRDNRFAAHATIARVKHLPMDQKGQLVSTIKDLSDVEVGTMKVDHIILKKSTLTPKGPIYEALHEVRL